MYVALLFVWISLLSCSLIRLSCAAPEPHSNSVDTGFVSGESSPKTATSAARGSAEIAPSGRRRDPVTGDEYGAMYGNSPDGQPGTPGGLTGIGGTLWCGVGNLAVDASQLGASAAADACCRQHDHCAYTIPAFSRRYGLFNFGAETMSHCACDAEFRRCLRMSRSSVALDIGRIFFNLRKKSCFRFNFEECWEKRGKGEIDCFRQRRQPTARRRNNPNF